MKKVFHFVLKFIITSIILYFIYEKMDINEFVLYFKEISFNSLIIITIIAILKVNIESYRWYYILKSLKQEVKLRSLFSIYMIGGFFNIFLPSTIGGDALRIMYIKNERLSTLQAINTVLLERITGIYAMLLITFIATVIGWNFILNEFRYTILIASGFGILFLTLFYNYYFIIINYAKKIKSRYNYKILDNIHFLIKSLDFNQYNKSVLFYSLIMSVFIQITVYSVTIFVGETLGLTQLKIYHYLILLPPIVIISLLPISIGGFGVREGLFSIFFSPLGVTLEQSTLLSILSFLPFLILGVFGSVFYLAKPKTSKAHISKY